VVVDERSQMVELCKEGLIHEVKCCPGLGGWRGQTPNRIGYNQWLLNLHYGLRITSLHLGVRLNGPITMPGSWGQGRCLTCSCCIHHLQICIAYGGDSVAISWMSSRM
jgi:hypothetical protein